MNFFKTIFKYTRSRVWFIVSVSVIVFFVVVGLLAEFVFFTVIGNVLGARPVENFGGNY